MSVLTSFRFWPEKYNHLRNKAILTGDYIDVKYSPVHELAVY